MGTQEVVAMKAAMTRTPENVVNPSRPTLAAPNHLTVAVVARTTTMARTPTARAPVDVACA